MPFEHSIASEVVDLLETSACVQLCEILSVAARSASVRAFASASAAPTKAADRSVCLHIEYFMCSSLFFSSEDVETITKTVEYEYDMDGCIVIELNGEKIWVPDVARSLEWVLSTPTDLHLFNETPVIKETTD